VTLASGNSRQKQGAATAALKEYETVDGGFIDAIS
jgi:hypothetical protein